VWPFACPIYCLIITILPQEQNIACWVRAITYYKKGTKPLFHKNSFSFSTWNVLERVRACYQEIIAADSGRGQGRPVNIHCHPDGAVTLVGCEVRRGGATGPSRARAARTARPPHQDSYPAPEAVRPPANELKVVAQLARVQTLAPARSAGVHALEFAPALALGRATLVRGQERDGAALHALQAPRADHRSRALDVAPQLLTGSFPSAKSLSRASSRKILPDLVNYDPRTTNSA